jgi:hypothetical protein
MPVAIIIHAGTPHDSRIFHEIMENLKKKTNNPKRRHNLIPQRILQVPKLPNQYFQV